MDGAVVRKLKDQENSLVDELISLAGSSNLNDRVIVSKVLALREIRLFREKLAQDLQDRRKLATMKTEAATRS